MSEAQHNPPQEICISTLRKRAEFVAMRDGRRQHMGTLLLQAKTRDGESRQKNAFTKPDARVGFTVTKKVGNAVQRNRIKRRLRSAVKHVLPRQGYCHHDYVVIGKRSALNTDFQTIVRELGTALKRVHQKSKQSGHPHG